MLVHPGRLFLKQNNSTIDGPEDLGRYATFLLCEAGTDSEPPINLTAIYERFGLPLPRRVSLPGQQGLLLDPEAGLILIEESDHAMRQRFTEAHELMELLFAVVPTKPSSSARDVGKFRYHTKERLCNAGAAALLMPANTFLPRVKHLGVSFETARVLANEYEVSLSAALIRMATIGPGIHAVVLWRMKNKPSEVKSQVPEQQMALLEVAPVKIASPKLRVEWSFTGSLSHFIPQDKSVPETSFIYSTWHTRSFSAGNDRLDLGSMRGITYSENLPFEAEAEWQVLSLLHLPGDVDCEGQR